jgi:hypothetical protein
MSHTMHRRTVLAFLAGAGLLVATPLWAQTKKDDIDVADLPADVRNVLEQYAGLLRASKDLAACASAFLAIAGGGLVNEDGSKLRSTVMGFGLKKDFENVKFYADPVRITRVAKLPPVTSGFGSSAITGPSFKIWIAKKEGAGGLPAPTTILVPEGHKTIKAPKVITIGSL